MQQHDDHSCTHLLYPVQPATYSSKRLAYKANANHGLPGLIGLAWELGLHSYSSRAQGVPTILWKKRQGTLVLSPQENGKRDSSKPPHLDLVELARKADRVEGRGIGESWHHRAVEAEHALVADVEMGGGASQVRNRQITRSAVEPQHLVTEGNRWADKTAQLQSKTSVGKNIKSVEP